MGDIVFASPIAAAIRRSHPDAHIAWLVESGLEVLLSDDTSIDEIITWPRREWARMLRNGSFVAFSRALLAFRRELWARRFDLALDLQGLLKSGLLTSLSGASRCVSLGGHEGSRWLMNQVVPKGGIEGRISSEYRFLAEQLGLQAEAFVPRLSVNSVSRNKAEARLSLLDVRPGAYVVIAPFTTRPQKHWREAEWARTADLLAERLKLRCIMLGGPENGFAARRIAKASEEILNLVGATTLDEARALIARSSLVVGVDTGLTHLGVALGRPTVALFGSTRPYLDPCYPWVRPIWLGLSCSPCRRTPICGGHFDCMNAITAERVTEEALHALAISATGRDSVSARPHSTASFVQEGSRLNSRPDPRLQIQVQP